MTFTLRSRLRGVTGATAAAALIAAPLLVSGIAVPSASADDVSASATAPVFTWEISQQFDNHLSTHVLEGGATESEDGAITFPNGVGTYDAGTGEASVSYQGSVAGSFAFNGNAFYEVTIAEPTVTVDDEGNGEISALVSAWDVNNGGEAGGTTPTRVVVTTFDLPDGGWTEADGLGSITATPDWTGVLPANSAEATELAIPADQPIDGASFAPTMLGQLTPGVRAHFYQSRAGQDVKAPSVFTAQAAAEEDLVPAVTVETTSADPEGGLQLQVNGTGFTGVTNPGDAGVYVGLAPAGGLPDVTSEEGAAAFAATAFVRAADLAEHTFSVGLLAETADLDPTQTYSIYTWQAHTHSNTSQDTETPIEIDWAALGLATETPTTDPTDDATTDPTDDATTDPTDDATTDPADDATNGSGSGDKSNAGSLPDTGLDAGLQVALALGLATLLAGGALLVRSRLRARA